ncbi:unnamed protein product [Schistocephalus solidus]|uniref:MAM domain-containing protein n=1 Tax=Schistocephalus solidus TaxID=70667 RepID=A0A183SH07_SCHSO|nr:unnamed protein product [Schistocephalus solidus]
MADVHTRGSCTSPHPDSLFAFRSAALGGLLGAPAELYNALASRGWCSNQKLWTSPTSAFTEAGFRTALVSINVSQASDFKLPLAFPIPRAHSTETTAEEIPSISYGQRFVSILVRDSKYNVSCRSQSDSQSSDDALICVLHSSLLELYSVFPPLCRCYAFDSLEIPSYPASSCRHQLDASTGQSSVVCTSDTLWTSAKDANGSAESGLWKVASIDLLRRAGADGDFKGRNRGVQSVQCVPNGLWSICVFVDTRVASDAKSAFDYALSMGYVVEEGVLVLLSEFLSLLALRSFRFYLALPIWLFLDGCTSFAAARLKPLPYWALLDLSSIRLKKLAPSASENLWTSGRQNSSRSWITASIDLPVSADLATFKVCAARSCILDTGLNTGRQALVCENEVIWSSDTPLLSSSEGVWSTSTISLNITVSDFKLILEGTIPAGYPDARICVDNITSYTEPCSALEPKPIKPVSSLNWAHYFGMIFIAALALGLIIPILFLVIIIFVCRRRHQYRHSNFANSKLFSTNLWHYIGGKEVAEDPFAEHTASFHRPPFMGNKFVGDGTLAMRNGDMMDLPDVVIPGGRVVAMGYNGSTLGPNGTMRHPSASFNGYPYSSMTMGKQMMGQPGMGYMQSPMTPNMATSQHNAQTMFQPHHFYNGNADHHMQPQQQMTQPPQQVQGTVANSQPPRMQTGAVQQAAPAVVPPSNYFRSLTQAVEDHPAPASHVSQPIAAATAATQPVAHPAVSSGDHAGNNAVPFEDNGPFVLPDPPSDCGQPGAHGNVERDQADALEALNSATEVSVLAAATSAPRSVATISATAGEPVYTGEHPPPGYDEAVGMVPSRRDQQKAALPVPAAAAVAPVLPPRRAGAGGQFAGNGQPPESAAGLSLAERYGLPVADI